VVMAFQRYVMEGRGIILVVASIDVGLSVDERLDLIESSRATCAKQSSVKGRCHFHVRSREKR